MALDNFVRFPSKDAKPDTAQVKEVLEDYLGEAGEVTEMNGQKDWLMATLPGAPSFPFRRQDVNTAIKGMQDGFPEERWFEVCCVHDDAIDVITRQQDELTNNLARGFAELAARWWSGNCDD